MRGTTSTVPYVDLPMGEDLILFPEDSQNHYPVDLSNRNLRQYSPFILEAVPPPMRSDYVKRKATFSQARPFSSPLNPRVSFLPRSRQGLGGLTLSPRASLL